MLVHVPAQQPAVETACRRDYSAIFRITPEMLKRRLTRFGEKKSFAARDAARRENYTRGVSVSPIQRTARSNESLDSPFSKRTYTLA